jgi:hypothetical protein
MSCAPSMNEREQKLLRALAHLMRKNHNLVPTQCEGCLEIAGFLSIPGYLGSDHPTCVVVYEEEEGRFRSHDDLKFSVQERLIEDRNN